MKLLEEESQAIAQSAVRLNYPIIIVLWGDEIFRFPAAAKLRYKRLRFQRSADTSLPSPVVWGAGVGLVCRFLGSRVAGAILGTMFRREFGAGVRNQIHPKLIGLGAREGIHENPFSRRLATDWRQQNFVAAAAYILTWSGPR